MLLGSTVLDLWRFLVVTTTIKNSANNKTITTVIINNDNNYSNSVCISYKIVHIKYLSCSTCFSRFQVDNHGFARIVLNRQRHAHVHYDRRNVYKEEFVFRRQKKQT